MKGNKKDQKPSKHGMPKAAIIGIFVFATAAAIVICAVVVHYILSKTKYMWQNWAKTINCGNVIVEKPLDTNGLV